MGDGKSTSGPEQEAEVTQETIEALVTKLDAFGEGLSVEERVVLGALLNAGMQAVSSEVKGFAGGHIDVESYAWGATSPLGTEVRRYDIVGAFPKKLEFGQMKAGDTP